MKPVGKDERRELDASERIAAFAVACCTTSGDERRTRVERHRAAECPFARSG